ncbi:hypothetical protein TRFO_11728 [Tritrichomonas foetus]|uniref:Uncharacterized protein n=1 Tax=Tritrichomonas foetus TaxID=1144522 RepID=A0A1J4J459_9EUKA|nr:hypothetical protein TRFO_11728 [Tritrichomonas foetus]|eukprot:OHS93521.1 hypothetical protein TRFO_11728 [Tritrichomonas foetus]
MKKRFNLLILGPDTRIGQALIKKINDHFHFLNIAIPTGLYKEQAVLPPYQLALNFANPELLAEDFQLAEVVVSCSPHYSTETIKAAAYKASSKFIDACFSYPQTVIEAACQRLPFRPTTMEATQSASGCSIIDLWRISHQITIMPFPRHHDNRWLIDQGTVSLEEISISHSFEFSSRIYAILFWFFSLLLRFMWPFFNDAKVYSSTSRWNFSGTGLEHHQEYRFRAIAEGVDAELLRPDLALFKSLDALGINRSESHDWGCCARMKVKLTEYRPVDSK